MFNQRGKEGQRNLSFLITHAWARGDLSLHVHSRISIRGELEARDFCWIFTRQMVGGDSISDWLYSWPPTKVVDYAFRIDKEALKKQSSVLVDIDHSFEHDQRVFLWLTAVERLNLLDQCPCIPINWDTIEWTSLPFLRRRFDPFQKLTAIHKDWERIIPRRFLIFPKNELPDDMIKRSANVVQAVPNDQRDSFWERREGECINDMPSIFKPEIDANFLGVLLRECPQFVVDSIDMFISPFELGDSAS
jgi:hypothetical protein